jgi:phage FluMu protein Com
MNVNYEIKCKHCGRFLGETSQSTTIKIKCSNSSCKKLETYKVVYLSEHLKNEHHNCDEHCNHKGVKHE